MLRMLLGFTFNLLVVNCAFAGVFYFPCTSGGTLSEFARVRTHFDIYLTNADGARLAPGTPLASGEANANNNFRFDVPIPPVNRRGDCDVFNVSQRLGNTGEVSELALESIFHDPLTNQFLIESTFGRIGDKLGFGVPVQVPDLFADTNGDTVLGEGDVLYSLVNMDVYLDAIPSFSLGDIFQIINGVVPALPGMMFSSTPFVYDPAVEFSGTPITITGELGAIHELTATAVPEPSTYVLFAIGILSLIGYRWRDRRSSERMRKGAAYS